MAKQGMKRPDDAHAVRKSDVSAVAEIQGKAKHGKKHVAPIIAGTHAPSLKVYHTVPHTGKQPEKPVSNIYSVIDNDLARDNLENDITAADLQDLY